MKTNAKGSFIFIRTPPGVVHLFVLCLLWHLKASSTRDKMSSWRKENVNKQKLLSWTLLVACFYVVIISQLIENDILIQLSAQELQAERKGCLIIFRCNKKKNFFFFSVRMNFKRRRHRNQISRVSVLLIKFRFEWASSKWIKKNKTKLVNRKQHTEHWSTQFNLN